MTDKQVFLVLHVAVRPAAPPECPPPSPKHSQLAALSCPIGGAGLEGYGQYPGQVATINALCGTPIIHQNFQS